MSEEILENIETPIEEETQTETENSNGSETESEILLPQRVNPFCVISKSVYGEYAVHDIQTNSAWGENPYGEDYAVVPDEMVLAIEETRGFCDIVLNEDETEVVEFTAVEIPEIPSEEPEPTLEERVTTLEETVALQTENEAELLYQVSLMQLGITENEM